MKVVLDLPKGFVRYWEFMARWQKRTLSEEISERLKAEALCDLDLMDSADLADCFGLRREYLKEYGRR